jgi:transglutaminase/protease-like cytokinesis protein 3
MSALLSELGRAAGVEIREVRGNVRDPQRGPDRHVWNVAKVGDRWVLIDVTWDANDARYLFMPATLFANDHFPDDPQWQLLEPPITESQFRHQPFLPSSAVQTTPRSTPLPSQGYELHTLCSSVRLKNHLCFD